jgi:Ion channel
VNYPKSQRYWFFEHLWAMPFWLSLVTLFGAYIVINLAFCLIEWQSAALDYVYIQDGKSIRVERSLADYLYFGFVTGTTVGYGDLGPHSNLGKLLAVLHALTSTLAFALIIALIAVKLLSPRNTLIFSSKCCFDLDQKRGFFRVMALRGNVWVV